MIRVFKDDFINNIDGLLGVKSRFVIIDESGVPIAVFLNKSDNLFHTIVDSSCDRLDFNPSYDPAVSDATTKLILD